MPGGIQCVFAVEDIMRMTNRAAMMCFAILLMINSISCGGSEEARNARSSFEKAELEWRDERDQRMKKSTSWLTIAGLFWLEEGENFFGTGPDSGVRLPEGSAPLHGGIFMLRGDEVKVAVEEGVTITYNDSTIKEMVLKSDTDGKPDVIRLNDLKMWVIKRGERFAIRLRDLNEPHYKNYGGLDFFEPKIEYRIKAEFVKFPEPKTIRLATVVGSEAEMLFPGYVDFNLKGKKYRLDVFGGGHDAEQLFIIFKDKTSGKETYGACRFLVADVLEDGSVDLNFNRAYNPPCAYTPYATCPLPPSQNELPIPIRAGEKQYGKGH